MNETRIVNTAPNDFVDQTVRSSVCCPLLVEGSYPSVEILHLQSELEKLSQRSAATKRTMS